MRIDRKKNMNMKTKAIVEKTAEGVFSIYLPDIGDILNAQGKSVSKAKIELTKVINTAKMLHKKHGNTAKVKFYEKMKLEYEYDVPSVFDDFSSINLSGFAKRFGYNSSLLRRYKSGITFASEKQVKRIESDLRVLGKDLSEICLK